MHPATAHRTTRQSSAPAGLVVLAGLLAAGWQPTAVAQAQANPVLAVARQPAVSPAAGDGTTVAQEVLVPLAWSQIGLTADTGPSPADAGSLPTLDPAALPPSGGPLADLLAPAGQGAAASLPWDSHCCVQLPGTGQASPPPAPALQPRDGLLWLAGLLAMAWVLRRALLRSLRQPATPAD